MAFAETEKKIKRTVNMEEGYLRFSTEEAEETVVFDLNNFLNDVKLEGLLPMDFVLEFYPKPYDEDRQYAIWQLIQDREDETLTMSMIERANEGMGWDTAQSLEIVFNLNGEFEYGSHHFGYAGGSSVIKTLDDLYDAYANWIYLGSLIKPTRISTNLEDI
jgi:hypothetical protein